MLASPVPKISIEFEYEKRNNSSWTVEVRKRVCVLTDDIVFCLDLMIKCTKVNLKCPQLISEDKVE